MRKIKSALSKAPALLLAGAAALSLSANAGHAAESQPVNRVGDWTISYHPDSRECSMITEFSRGTSIMVMWDRDIESWVLFLGNRNWTSIGQGTSHTVTLRMDGYDDWHGTMKGGVTQAGNHILMLPVKKEFIIALMKRYKVDIYGNDGKLITGLPLDNSYAAMLATVECQRQAYGR
jgi:hypothetical protein